MFTLFLKNYHDQNLIRRVREETRLANIIVPTLARETFAPLLLAEGKYVDRAEIDACARNTALFLDITVGLNEDYRRICDSIYVSMGQVSKEKQADDREAARRS